MISSSPREGRRLASRGFTLIELLVVMGIILLLISILVPMANRAYRQAIRTRMAADLQVISQALEAYKHDFGDYPRPSAKSGSAPAVDGAAILCWALAAPGPATQDGADGMGFRIRGTQGAVRQPYIPTDRFMIGVVNSTGIVAPPGSPPVFDDRVDVIGDRYNHAILYFAANSGVNATASYPERGGTYVGQYNIGTTPAPAMFNYNDNIKYLSTGFNPNNILTMKTMRFRLGDRNTNGIMDVGEVPVATGSYLLWAAGPDQAYGTDDDVAVDSSGELPLNVPLPSRFVP